MNCPVCGDARSRTMNENPLVSVVITTKNEEKNIEACLQSIKEQTYPNIEIIVVDNFSTDATVEIARRYTEHVYQKGPERSAQRNYGMIEKAKGKYVMYVDADMVLSPSLIEKCVEVMETQSDVLALHVPEIVLGKNFWSKVRRFERQFYDGTVIDGARFFRKDIFVEVGGFDENFSGPEDWDLDKKIKQKGKILLLQEKESSQNVFIDDFVRLRGIPSIYLLCCIYHNEAEFDMKKYLQKKAYYVSNFDPYIEKWGKDDPDLRKQFGLWYRYFGVFLEHGKWKMLLEHPLLTLGMYVLRIRVGFVFLMKHILSSRGNNA